MIQTEGLTKKYGDFTAVDSVDLSIPAGEIYGFLGPNGAGKTSTIMMLLGITSPTAGRIQLFGEEYTSGRLDLRRRIGVVPEKHPVGMWSWMTAGEYLSFFADIFGLKNPGKRIEDLLTQVQLIGVANKRISEFSRGMLQKLSIVRALLHDPDILFLDEPISGLDPIGIKQVRDLIIAENREGRTIFISSHLLSEMEKICHRVAIIFNGKLLAEDSMDILLLKLARDREIDIDLEEVPAGLAEEIEKLDFVNSVSVTENTIAVKVPKEGDYRKDISRFLIKKELIPLQFKEKSISLEEAFVTITQDNVKLLAGVGGKA